MLKIFQWFPLSHLVNTSVLSAQCVPGMVPGVLVNTWWAHRRNRVLESYIRNTPGVRAWQFCHFMLLHEHYHKFSSLKQNKFIFSVSVGQEFGQRLIGISAQDPERLGSKCWLALPYHIEHRVLSKIVPIADRIQFFVVVELRSPVLFPKALCSLSPGQSEELLWCFTFF